MQEKKMSEISQPIMSIYYKGIEAFNKGSSEYAIEMLKTVVIREPGFLIARNKLRQFEKNKALSTKSKKFMASLKLGKIIKIGQLACARKKYIEGMHSAEEALAIDVTKLSALKLLAEAGEGLETPFIVIEAYELAYELYSENAEVMRLLADVYSRHKMGIKELAIRKKIVQMFPNDIHAKSELRSASASAALEEHDMENLDRALLDRVKDKDEARALEQSERNVHSIEDIQRLIDKYEEELKTDPDSIKLLRSLAQLYKKGGLYSNALQYYQRVVQINEVFDAVIDAEIEQSELSIIKDQIKELIQIKKEDPSQEDEVDEKISNLEDNQKKLRLNYALNRVKNYPNDFDLRYLLAIELWYQKEIELAIEQFQLAQKNIRNRISSMLYLGQCFLYKKQYDIAIDQFLKITDELKNMTKEKVEALYYLGITYEKLDNSDKAKECFKSIYSVQSNYKDVSQRIQKYYE